MWQNNTGQSVGLLPGRQTFGPLALMLVTAPFVMLIWYANAHLDGSLYALLPYFQEHGLYAGFVAAMPSMSAILAQWRFVLTYCLFEIVLMMAVPGGKHEGPMSPSGHVPVYKANGVQCYVITLATYAYIVYAGHYELGYVYAHFGELLAFMNVFSLAFCALLFVKGHVAPSSTDHGSSGNWVIDYYWGMELYPRIFGVDVKQFTNCRFGMMAWALIIIEYAGHQYVTYGTVSDSMLVSVGLQLVYITKFFIWETGYFNTIDIMHDRAGYYICWGCLVWLPCVYTCPSMYLTNHPVTLGTPLAVAMFILGVFFTFLNYDMDRQRQQFRATNGEANITGMTSGFGGEKPKFIVAKYATKASAADAAAAAPKTPVKKSAKKSTKKSSKKKTSTAKKSSSKKKKGSAKKKTPTKKASAKKTSTKTGSYMKTSLLLTSGYWGMSRHGNYVAEISAAFMWSVPALFANIAPFFYVIFLTFLLGDRAFRDDARCADKYGTHWDRYCKAVPYRFVKYLW